MTIRLRDYHSRAAACVLVWLGLCLLPVVTTNGLTAVVADPPILISQPTSTRAIAIDSLSFTSEPFALNSPNAAGSERRTRVMLFAMNLKLQPGEPLSAVTADAEDAAHQHYNFTVEYVGAVPEQEWLTTVILRLSDSLTDVGDVLVRVSYNGVASNRVRVGIVHVGGGPPDDQGAVPTPVKPFIVSGQTRDDNNNPLVGAELTLTDSTDGSVQTTTTGADGGFSIGASPGHNVIVTPTNNAVFSYSAAQSFDKIAADQVVSFQATRHYYSIAGKLTGSVGNGTVPGATVNLSGFRTATTTTDQNGNYVFTNVAAGGDYTISVPQTDHYTFVPQSFSFSGNRIVNFAGVLRSYTVSGWVQLGPLTLAGLVVPISGSQTTTVTTDANGNYSIVLPAGGNYTITPSLTHYDFDPVSQIITDLRSDQINRSFNGTRRFYSINGKLTGSVGNGTVPGATVILSGSHAATTTSDSNGNYVFPSVEAGGDYTITVPQTDYYTFTSQSFTNLSGNRIVDFAGALRSYTVSGWVQLGPSTLAGLEVPITGSQTATVTTDANGNYSIVLPAGGNYTITPSLTYYEFTPTSQIITDLRSDQINRFFVGNRKQFSISGKLKDQEGNGLSGMTVILTGAPELRTSVTDGAGHYMFMNLDAGYNYTVTPNSTAVYVFAPHNFIDLTANQTFDFTGLRRLVLSGRVKDQNGAGLIGVTVTLSGTESGSTITAADGSYSLIATATGNYTVTPAIGQNWFAFAPATAQYTNLAGAQTADFSGTLAPVPDPPFVLEFDGAPKTVDYGPFWPEGVNLGHFFWEFWAMPGPQASATYMLSDGYGGAHALLFGVGSFNTSEVNRYELLGNIFDGVRFDNYFGSDVGPAVGEWAHFAVGWDGQNIITYYNGVPVGKTPFSGPRRTPGPGGGGGRLLIGGSDHSNFNGRIAQLRGYEDTNPREGLPGGVEASFAPQTVFGLGGNLLSYYFRSAPSVADLSSGYRGLAHAGTPRGTTAGIIFDCNGCPPPQFVIDPSAPNFATGAPPPPPNVPPAAPPPAGALVFDSFSRANSTYTFGGHGGLSSTESGSAGIKIWQTNQPAANPQPFGILNVRAVLLANSTAVAWVPTGSATGDLDVRVNRYTGRWGSGIHSGLSFRVVDANNFFFAYTADSGGNPNIKIVRVGYYLNGQRVDLTNGEAMPSNWTTLRVVTSNSGELSVYVDAALVYSTNSPQLATATGAGLYSDAAGMGLVNRWDNFTVLPAP